MRVPNTKLSCSLQVLVAESLAKVGLSGVERLYPSELSGGMKKRVALARAIVRDEQHDDVEQVSWRRVMASVYGLVRGWMTG